MASAQQNENAGKNGPVPATSLVLSQQERAEAAMQKALARQQAALDHWRGQQTSGSLQKQHASILRQVSAHSDPAARGTLASSTATPAPPAEESPDHLNDFFMTPWPASVPLSVPNVQVAEAACEALPKDQIDQLIEDSSRKQGVDREVLRSVMRQESAFRPCAQSVKGAMGLMQIMPDTADLLGLDDPFDPAKNVEAGAKYLRMMLDRYQGNLPMALGAYNAGPGRVDKAGGIPPLNETIQYITNILRNLPQ